MDDAVPMPPAPKRRGRKKRPPIVKENLSRADADLEQITRQVIAADGSYFRIYADVAWALHQKRSNGRPGARVRLNFQLDVRSWVPAALSISGKAQGSDSAAVAADLLPDVIYLVDRNFIDFDFFHAVLDKGSDFVVRCKDNMPNFQPRQDRPLTDRDRADGVLGDRLGILPGRGAGEGRRAGRRRRHRGQ